MENGVFSGAVKFSQKLVRNGSFCNNDGRRTTTSFWNIEGGIEGQTFKSIGSALSAMWSVVA